MASLSSLTQLAESSSGYPLLVVAVLLSAAGVPLPISALLLAVGVTSAHVGVPLLVLLGAVCTLAAATGDSLDYLLGRFGAPAFIARCLPRLVRLGERLGLGWPPSMVRWRERWMIRAEGSHRRSAVLALFTSRFLPPLMPLATPISVALGAARFAFVRFLIWDLFGEAIFVIGNIVVGRLLSGPLAALATSPLLLWATIAALTLLPAAFALIGRRRRVPPAAGGQIRCLASA